MELSFIVKSLHLPAEYEQCPYPPLLSQSAVEFSGTCLQPDDLDLESVEGR